MRRLSVMDAFRIMGPAFLVSVALVDPGNWATAIEAGSKFGYELVWVVVASNLIAILLQTLAARLGIVTGKHLAQVCRESYPPQVCALLWLLCEISIVALDLTMLLGTAIGLNLLLGWPLLPCIIMTSLDALLLLLLVPAQGVKKSEALTVGLLAVVVTCFMVDLIVSRPPLRSVVSGLIPRLRRDSVYTAVSLLGANIMPHNFYLHSALVSGQAAAAAASGGEAAGGRQEHIRALCMYNVLDIGAALGVALVINVALLLVSAATFHSAGVVVHTLQAAHDLMEQTLSSSIAPAAFGTALLCAGQLSTFTGTIAGQVVLQGFLNIHISTWLRRLITRTAAIIPAAVLQYVYGDRGTYKFLLIAQVVLALQLPVTLVPLIKATSSRQLMGCHTSSRLMTAAAWAATGLVFLANLMLFITQMLPEVSTGKGILDKDGPLDAWIDRVASLALNDPLRAVGLLGLLVAASAFLALQLWMILTPLRVDSSASAVAIATTAAGGAAAVQSSSSSATTVPRCSSSNSIRNNRSKFEASDATAAAAAADHVLPAMRNDNIGGITATTTVATTIPPTTTTTTTGDGGGGNDGHEYDGGIIMKNGQLQEQWHGDYNGGSYDTGGDGDSSSDGGTTAIVLRVRRLNSSSGCSDRRSWWSSSWSRLSSLWWWSHDAGESSLSGGTSRASSSGSYCSSSWTSVIAAAAARAARRSFGGIGGDGGGGDGGPHYLPAPAAATTATAEFARSTAAHADCSVVLSLSLLPQQQQQQHLLPETTPQQKSTPTYAWSSMAGVPGGMTTGAAVATNSNFTTATCGNNFHPYSDPYDYPTTYAATSDFYGGCGGSCDSNGGGWAIPGSVIANVINSGPLPYVVPRSCEAVVDAAALQPLLPLRWRPLVSPRRQRQPRRSGRSCSSVSVIGSSSGGSDTDTATAYIVDNKSSYSSSDYDDGNGDVYDDGSGWSDDDCTLENSRPGAVAGGAGDGGATGKAPVGLEVATAGASITDNNTAKARAAAFTDATTGSTSVDSCRTLVDGESVSIGWFSAQQRTRLETTCCSITSSSGSSSMNNNNNNNNNGGNSNAANNVPFGFVTTPPSGIFTGVDPVAALLSHSQPSLSASASIDVVAMADVEPAIAAAFSSSSSNQTTFASFATSVAPFNTLNPRSPNPTTAASERKVETGPLLKKGGRKRRDADNLCDAAAVSATAFEAALPLSAAPSVSRTARVRGVGDSVQLTTDGAHGVASSSASASESRPKHPVPRSTRPRFARLLEGFWATCYDGHGRPVWKTSSEGDSSYSSYTATTMAATGRTSSGSTMATTMMMTTSGNSTSTSDTSAALSSPLLCSHTEGSYLCMGCSQALFEAVRQCLWALEQLEHVAEVMWGPWPLQLLLPEGENQTFHYHRAVLLAARNADFAALQALCVGTYSSSVDASRLLASTPLLPQAAGALPPPQMFANPTAAASATSAAAARMTVAPLVAVAPAPAGAVLMTVVEESNNTSRSGTPTVFNHTVRSPGTAGCMAGSSETIITGLAGRRVPPSAASRSPHTAPPLSPGRAVAPAPKQLMQYWPHSFPSDADVSLPGTTGLSSPTVSSWCVFGPAALVSFGVWTIFTLAQWCTADPRPAHWGQYASVLNRLQGLLRDARLDVTVVTNAAATTAAEEEVAAVPVGLTAVADGSGGGEMLTVQIQSCSSSPAATTAATVTSRLPPVHSHQHLEHSRLSAAPSGGNRLHHHHQQHQQQQLLHKREPASLPPTALRLCSEHLDLLRAELLRQLEGMEAYVLERRGPADTAAGQVAFPKAKAIIASVMRRYRRRFGRCGAVLTELQSASGGGGGSGSGNVATASTGGRAAVNAAAVYRIAGGDAAASGVGLPPNRPMLRPAAVP